MSSNLSEHTQDARVSASREACAKKAKLKHPGCYLGVGEERHPSPPVCRRGVQDRTELILAWSRPWYSAAPCVGLSCQVALVDIGFQRSRGQRM